MNYRLDFPDPAKVAGGALLRLMTRCVLTVEGNAKQQLRPGRGKKTGTLQRDIRGIVEEAGERGRVGTNISYALDVHEGTGLYGPKKRPIAIKARNKKALFWKGAEHPVRSVKSPGMRGIPFLREGMALSRDSIDALLRREGEQMLREAIGR